MRVIDLLNKIANGEEVPKRIRITNVDDRITRHYNFFYDEDEQEYKDDELFPLGARLILDRVLNEKVEIIEKDKEIKKIDIMSDEATPNSYYILNEHGTKCYLTKHSKVIADRVNLLIDKVNNMENKQ